MGTVGGCEIVRLPPQARKPAPVALLSRESMQTPHWPISLAERLTPSLRFLLLRVSVDPDEAKHHEAAKTVLGDSYRMARLADIAAGLYRASCSDGDAERTPTPDAADSWCRLTTTWADLRAKVIALSNGS